MRVTLDCWQHGPRHPADVTEGRLEAREERRAEAWRGLSCRRAGCAFCASSTPAITTEQQIPGLTCCSVGSAKGGSGNRRSGSGISSCCRSLWVPGTAGDFKQRAPVATSAPQEGPSRARGPLCLLLCAPQLPWQAELAVCFRGTKNRPG